MQVDFFDRYSRGSTAVHRMDARWKLVGGLLLVAGIVMTPWRWWPVYIVQGLAILAGVRVARLPWSYMAARLAGMLPFVLLLAGSIPLARGLVGGWDLAAQLVVQSVLSLAVTITIVATTPFGQLLEALARLRVPRVLVSILAFMYRYIFVLTDEREKMRRAKLSRTFYPSWSWDVRHLGNFVGMLFVRAFERSERVYAAMCARGWTGEMPGRDGEP
jgi:cobalt/nickel transport system permease protein